MSNSWLLEHSSCMGRGVQNKNDTLLFESLTLKGFASELGDLISLLAMKIHFLPPRAFLWIL